MTAKRQSSTDLVARFRIDDGSRFRLSSIDPGDTAGVGKARAKAGHDRYIARLAELQEKLYAQDRWVSW
jgi:hypothetical protein